MIRDKGREERQVRSLTALQKKRREKGKGLRSASVTLRHAVDRDGLSKNGEGSSVWPKCIPTSAFEKLHSRFLFIKLSDVLNAEVLELE